MPATIAGQAAAAAAAGRLPDPRDEYCSDDSRAEPSSQEPIAVSANFQGGDEIPSAVDLKMLVPYSELRPHAKGGLGVVYSAVDRNLHRAAAVKCIQNRHSDNPDLVRRFLMEAEVTGRLDHPGVVPVYGMGRTAEGRPFYAMRFIRGKTLTEAVDDYHDSRRRPTERQRNLELRQLLQRFIAVCNTIAYAHDRGIVHRDIKPDNIMLGRYGETLVIDWGLALSVQRDALARASGEQTLLPKSAPREGDGSGGAGTPAYMSPEQADGELPVGRASDVYSLGATLYKMLTNRAPASGMDRGEIRQCVLTGDFMRPRHVVPGLPPALDAICMKALSLKPGDRYQNPLALAEDVERFLGDEPVAACRETFGHKIRRFLKRHRRVAQVGTAALVVVVGTVFGAALQLRSAASKERDARLSAEYARTHALQLAARFAARTVAGEIDLRWRILETEADDPRLRELMRQVEAAR
ncbi:MAG: serine/threonine-protein kinase, partial [Planctomycetia bacterium]